MRNASAVSESAWIPDHAIHGLSQLKLMGLALECVYLVLVQDVEHLLGLRGDIGVNRSGVHGHVVVHPVYGSQCSLEIFLLYS